LAALQKTSMKFRRTLLGDSSPKKAIVVNVVTGTGVDTVLRAVDNVFGSPAQRIFAIQVPIIGNVGPIQAANYLIHAGGLKASLPGLIAVLGSVLVRGGIGSISNVLAIPGLGAVANPAATPAGPGAPI